MYYQRLTDIVNFCINAYRLHTYSTIPLHCYYYYFFDQSVNQTINQSIDSSIDQSINEKVISARPTLSQDGLSKLMSQKYVDTI